MASPAAVLQILVTANSSQANATLAKTEGRLRAVEGTAGRTSAALSTMGKVGAFGVAAVGAVSVKMAADFDRSMRNVNSIAQLSEKQFGSLEKQVLGLAGKTAQAPKTLADGLYDLVSSGFKANESIKILHASARAATAGLTDTATSTKAVAAVLNAYRLPAAAAKKVSDELFNTVNYGVLSFQDLAQTIGDTLPFAASLGVKLKEVGAATATMTKQGLSSSETMTRIRNVMQTLIKPGKELNTAFEELNTTGEQLVQKYGLQGALEKLVATTDGTKDAVAGLFPNIRALGGVLSLTGKNAQAAEQDLKAMGDSSGATAKVLSEQTKSVSYQWQKFKAQLSVLAIEIGQKLLPALNSILRWLNELDLKPAIQALKDFWKNAGLLRDIVGKALDAIKQNFKGLKEFISGTVKIVSGILTGDFGKAWDGVKDIFKAGKDSILSILRAITAPFRAVIEKLAEILDDVFGGAWRKATSVVEDAASAILGTTHHLTVQINKGFQAIFKYTNAALSSLGVKPVAFSLANAVAEGAAQGHQKGGVIHAARGRMVPGRGSGDKVPAMLEPGEVVLNRNAVRAMGGARKANRINRMIPRFQKGGEVGGMAAMQAMANKFEAADEPYLLGGGHGGFLTGPAPVDCSGFVSAVLHAGGLLNGAPMVSGALMNWGKPGKGPLTVYANPEHTFMQLNGKYYGTSNSNPNGGAGLVEGGYDPGYLSGFVTRTMDVAGGIASNIKRVLLKGPDGPLKNMGQAALDKVRRAANAYVSSKVPAGIAGGGDTQVDGPAIKNLPKSLAKFNHVYSAHVAPDYGGYQMPVPSIVQLANWAGLPGQTFAKIAHGESDYRPGAIGIDSGGTKGYGLWQITTRYSDADVQAATGGTDYGQMLNPILNAGAAKHKYDATGLGAWQGTQYLQSGGIVGDTVQHFAGGGTAKKPPKFHPPKSALAPNDIASAWQNVTSGGGPSTYHPTPSAYTPGPSIALQFAQLDVAMANAATTMDVADDRAVLDQRALLVNSQIAKVTSQLSQKGLSAARRLALTEKLADLKGQLNSIASDQQALYPKPDFIGGDQTVYDTSAQDAAAAQAAADLAAQQALTDAIAALTAEMAAQNALINSTLQSDMAQSLATVGALLSGEIGGQIAPRLHTAGSGSVVRA